MNVLEPGLGGKPVAFAAVLVVRLVANAAPVRCAPLVEENSGGSAATHLVGQGGWAQTGSTSTNPIPVNAPGLTLAGDASTSENVEVLAEGIHAPGRHAALWSGGAAHAGVYFVRIETPGGAFTRRFVLGR